MGGLSPIFGHYAIHRTLGKVTGMVRKTSSPGNRFIVDELATHQRRDGPLPKTATTTQKSPPSGARTPNRRTST